MAILTPREVLAHIVATSVFRDNASDADASKCASVYPSLKGDGSLIKAGTRINRDGKLYRSRVDLWDTAGNSPESAPSLWEEIMYKQGYRIIPETITAENPFMKGERGWWNGVLYESILENVNTYTPTTYPAGWRVVK